MLPRSAGYPRDVGAKQSAVGALPVQYFVVPHANVTAWRHWLASALQVINVLPEHELPTAAQLVAGHVQSAVGKEPAQGFVAGHVVGAT